jgi:glycosyltransferase involved in cell wall biosynthesis
MNDTSKLVDLILATKGSYIWVFQGSIPDGVVGVAGVEVEQYPWKPFMSYPGMLHQIHADAAVIPLIASEFNRGKSDIKLLELSAVGVPTMCADIGPMGPYENAPYKVAWDAPIDTWSKKLRQLVTDKQLYIDIRRKQAEYVSKRWLELPENIGKWMEFYGIK